MDIEKVKELALANGFKLKEQASGNMDLNAYVYDFANAVEREAKAQSDQKIKLLLCDEHLKKCESPTGIFNSQYPDEEPCLICLVKEAKAQAMPEWISVKDEMPEQGQKVLVFRPHAHEKPYKDPNYKICTYAGEDIFINSHFEHEIPHWMPLTNPMEQSQ
ncbi:DUF551 domain-containing protein [Acinetobacter bohemicus]|uniref:DUF551 domain-containing protein n=1 Tax=Acinetobacter TaxID=469 RepID=UPI00209BAF5C|nr:MULTISPECIES: DUF551 domain-containing protein [Acinetobacter]MCO8042899.1 DUF551 domain-containing protein [Acinetobacter sp. S4400-12]MCU7225167.1 DUF551 domain-containing protein [Acinetobacter bohemicus]